MRILWVMQHAGFVRYFESALEALDARGHVVQIALEEPRNKLDERVAAEAVERRLPGVRLEDVPPVRRVWPHALAQDLRAIRDTLRYRGAEYDDAPEMRQRSERFVPKSIVALVRLAAGAGTAMVGLLDRACERIDRSIPPHPSIAAYVRERQPDLIIATPYVNFGSDQSEFLRSAASLGIPTAAAIPSWDNLTTKGRMAWVPDRLLVWNNAQAPEAHSLHGVPPERVAVCGAPVFDHWFDWQPSRDRHTFCRQVGLDPSRPYVLYLGSSLFLAPFESEFVGDWLSALRESDDPGVATAGILIRPHPTNWRQWNSASVEQFGDVAIWPAKPPNPSTDQFRRDFYDSLHHCAAVVGVNTSAQIEAAILRRPVLATPVVEQTRFGARTLHFAHLAGGDEPLLWTAPDWATHFEQLGKALANADIAAERSDRFVERFVRPHGRGRRAGAVVAESLEALAAAPRVAVADAPPAAAFVRGLAAIPGRPLVWMFDNQGAAVWKLALSGAMFTFVAVAAPCYRLADLPQALAERWRRRSERRRAVRTARAPRRKRTLSEATHPLRAWWKATNRSGERVFNQTRRGWREVRRQSPRRLERAMKGARRFVRGGVASISRRVARLLRLSRVQYWTK